MRVFREFYIQVIGRIQGSKRPIFLKDDLIEESAGNILENIARFFPSAAASKLETADPVFATWKVFERITREGARGFRYYVNAGTSLQVIKVVSSIYQEKHRDKTYPAIFDGRDDGLPAFVCNGLDYVLFDQTKEIVIIEEYFVIWLPDKVGWKIRAGLARSRTSPTQRYDKTPSRLAIDAEIEGKEIGPTGFERRPVVELIAICDGYWNSILVPNFGALKDQTSIDPGGSYSRYVDAINELGRRGPEILDWVIARLRHPTYEAREMAAWVLGELGSRNQLGEKHQIVIDELTWLATRSIEDDTKEAQANNAALLAFGKIGDRHAVTALRHVLTAPEWNGNDMQWDAAEVLGKLIGESFVDKDRVKSARAWLESQE